MTMTKEKLGIGEIANRLVNWRNNGNADRVRTELYSQDIESIEEGFGNDIGKVKGMAGLKKKGEGLSREFEVHDIRALNSVIADNWFSVKYEIEVTLKKTGERCTLSEIGMYKVDDDKIVKEHYFMW